MGEAHLVHFCAMLTKDNANKTGTLLKATNKLSEVEQWFGVWRTPEQAVEAVEHIQHCLDMQIPVPDLLLGAIATVLESGPHKVASSKAAHFKRLLPRMKELEEEKSKLYATLDSQVLVRF